MKKLVSILMAIMMIAMVGAAFADAATLTDGKTGTAGTALSDGVAITKQIIFVNAENTTVREPNITYEYTVAAVTVGFTAPTVTDTNNTTVTVKSGVLDANTNTNHKETVSFTDTATASATSTGTADSKTFTLTFDPTKFTAAGVYRYSVTENIATGSNTKAAVGISEAATYATTRYLDVYVEWDSTHTNLEIYGYVLFEDSTNSGTTGAITTSTTKSQGWIDTDSNSSDTVHTDVDVYTTQNLYLNKTTTGTMADKNQTFTLNYTATIPSTVTATVKIDTIATNSTITNQETADTVGAYINSTNFAKTGGNTVTVKDGSVVAFKGIPAGGTVTVTETNNSPDVYKVKAGEAADGATLLTEAPVLAGNTSNATTSKNLTDKVQIYFTNTLDAISPTGYVSRFAPYALILVAGIALLIVAKKRKPAKDDEE